MVLNRTSFDQYSRQITEWYFRHDTIADFFVMQAFLEENSHRTDRHLGDSRFNGVYELLGDSGALPDDGLQSFRSGVHSTENTSEQSSAKTILP
jgi:hypothetical protein